VRDRSYVHAPASRSENRYIASGRYGDRHTSDDSTSGYCYFYYRSDPDGGGSRDGNRDGNEQSGGHRVPADMLGELYGRAGSCANGCGGDGVDVCWMEWSGLHGNKHLLCDDECGGNGDGDVQHDCNEFHASRNRGRDRNGDSDEQSGGHRVPADMFGKLYERAGSCANGRASDWVDVRRLEWRGLHGNGYVFGDDECS
jgi:hypothetical protein